MLVAVLVQMLVVMGMLMRMLVGMAVFVGVGNTVVGVLVGVGMFVGMLMIATQGMIVSKMHKFCSFAFFYIILVRCGLVNFLKAVTGIQQPHEGIVGFLVGKKDGEGLFDSQSFQGKIQAALLGQ